MKTYKIFASLLIIFAFLSVQAWAADPPPAAEKMPAILASLDAGKVTVLDDKAAGAIRGQAYQYVLVRTVLNAFDFAPGIQWSLNPLAYRYGAWGGPGWTNGGDIGSSAPADLMDTYFMGHDQGTLSDAQLIVALGVWLTTSIRSGETFTSRRQSHRVRTCRQTRTLRLRAGASWEADSTSVGGLCLSRNTHAGRR